MPGKAPGLDELLRDPKARNKLTELQLYNFIQQLKELASGLGRPDRTEPSPADFAVRLSKGEWKAADHLRYLSNELARLERRERRFLAVSMPPRHGKSLLIDVWFPIWWLTRNPKARIILAGYNETFARQWGAQVRDKIIEHFDDTNIVISKDQTAATDWLTSLGGGMMSVGVGGALTGYGADLLICDDPIKNDQEANSQVYRDRMWDWWQASALTRLQPNGVVVVVACLTGDTPILRADGSETPIRDLCPGDRVATYEDGQITYSVVRNWANQGPDYVFAIRMTSGTIVRANARHPFLVARDGGTEWVRTDTLKKGDHILRVTGASGGGSVALNAASQQCAKDSANPTTTKTVGSEGQSPHQHSILTSGVMHTFATVMESALRSITGFWQHKVAPVLSASNYPQQTNLGSTDCSLIIATTRDTFVDSYATPATSSLDTHLAQKYSNPLQTTYDEVVSVNLVGIEDVYDIEVERTHNFVANGLVTHNTRWHEDDLLGRIEKENDGRWTFLKLAALAPDDDPLGRPVGSPLWPERFPDDPDYSLRKGGMSPYWWSALFQQTPTPEGGGIIQRDWFRFYHTLPDDCDLWIQSWDPALLDTSTSDFWVGQVWARRGADLYLVDSARGHYNLAQAVGIIRTWNLKYPKATGKLIERTAMGPAIIQTLQHEVPGIIPWPPLKDRTLKGSKRSRVEAIVPVLMAGNVHLPEEKDGTKPRWVWDLIEECAAFDKGTYDDQVDALSQAVSFLLPGAWRTQQREAAEASKPAPPTPREERTAAFNAYTKRVLDKAARRRRPYASRPLW